MAELVRVQPRLSTWETLGVERHPGVMPEGVAPSWNEHGPDGLTFTLRRDPNVQHVDLEEFTPIEYLPDGGDATWTGYTIDTPGSTGDEDIVTVQAKGWQHYLDDDVFAALYAHEDLSEWKDIRTLLGANLAFSFAAPIITVDGGVITIMIPRGTTVPAGMRAGVVLDLGPTFTARRVVVDWQSSGNDATTQFALAATPNDDFGLPPVESGFGVGLSSAAARTDASTLTAGHRKLFVYLYRSASGTFAADVWTRITGIRVFGQTAYETANQSILKASDIVKDIPPRYPLLSQDLSQIAATTLNLRHFTASDENGRQVLERANGYHSWRWKVDERRRLLFQPQTDRPALRVDLAKPGAKWADASANNGAALYNRVIVVGSSGSGVPLRVVRTTTDIGVVNTLDARGRTRTYRLDVQAPTDTTAMQALGDAFLRMFSTTPLAGSVEVTADDAVTLIANNAPVPLGELGRWTTEQIMLANLIDPDTGAVGRVGTIKTVSRAGDRATIAIDSDRGAFAALLARMGATGRPT